MTDLEQGPNAAERGRQPLPEVRQEPDQDGQSLGKFQCSYGSELALIREGDKTEGAIDACNMLKPMLARGELHCIGANTRDEYHKYIEKDAALERRFQPVRAEEPKMLGSRAEVERVGREAGPAPVSFDMFDHPNVPVLTAAELERMGYSVDTFPFAATLGCARTLEEMYTFLDAEGAPLSCQPSGWNCTPSRRPWAWPRSGMGWNGCSNRAGPGTTAENTHRTQAAFARGITNAGRLNVMDIPEVVNPQNCSGCGICELACSFFNVPDRSFRPAASHVQIVRLDGQNRFRPELSDQCNGCGVCATHCEYGVFAARSAAGGAA